MPFYSILPHHAGKHLAQHCRLEYPRALNYILWVIAEVGIIASDIPQGGWVETWRLHTARWVAAGKAP